MIKKITVIVAIMMFGMVSAASAVVMTFDEFSISSAGGYVNINNYQGFNFSNGGALNTNGLPSDNGYLTGCVSPHNVLFNPWGNDLRISSTTDFTFDSGYFSSAHLASQTVSVTGYNDSVESFNTHFEVTKGTSELMTFNWVDVDRVLIHSDSHGHLAMDNFSFNEEGVPAAPVPEPATCLLLGCGLVGMATINRKRLLNN